MRKSPVQYFGARDRENLALTIGNCTVACGVTSLFIMIAGAFVTGPLLHPEIPCAITVARDTPATPIFRPATNQISSTIFSTVEISR